MDALSADRIEGLPTQKEALTLPYKDPEKQGKAHYAANKAYYAAKNKAWRIANKESRAANFKAWHAANPEKAMEYSANRRAVYAANPEKGRIKRSEWVKTDRQAHPERYPRYDPSGLPTPGEWRRAMGIKQTVLPARPFTWQNRLEAAIIIIEERLAEEEMAA
jgi:hypothetical protein